MAFDANAYVLEYGRGAVEVLQKKTFLYEGVFQPMAPGDWDKATVTYRPQADYHYDVTDFNLKVSDATYGYTRRQVVKKPIVADVNFYDFQMDREGVALNQIADGITDIGHSLARKKNAIVAESVFADGVTFTNNNTTAAAAFPQTDAAYVVHANAATNPTFGAPTTYGLHYDKLLRGFQLLNAQGYDPNAHSEDLYLICKQSDYDNLRASRDGADNLIVASSDFTVMRKDIVMELDVPLTRTLVRFSNKLWIIIDDSFFNASINSKTTGVGSTTLTNGRRLPMFLGSAFRWYDDIVRPLTLVDLPEYHARKVLKEARNVSLTRVQEKGVVEIEVATAVA